MATGSVKAVRMFPNYNDLLYNNNGTYTATKPCYFYAVVVAPNDTYKVTVNGVEVGARDSSGSTYLTIASGYLSAGDVLSGSGMKRVWGLKSE